MTNWTPELEGRAGPRYRAIADALADDVAAGRLAAGARLPTHRDLAYRLGVTVGTITRAYAEAEKRGLIGGEVGRGTFVLGTVRSAFQPEPLTWTPPAEPSVINMTVLRSPQQDAAQALAGTLASIAASGNLDVLVGYAPHAGLPAHRAAGAQWLARWHNVSVPPGWVLLATGAQNAMAVATAAVARPGDVVLTERLTNYGMKALCATLGVHLEGVAMDDDGLLPEAFDAACRRLAPKALYTVPTLHNPTASVMPAARRAEIAAIARRHEVVIVEDDVFGFLLDGVEPIQAFAPEQTIYLTSLSKSVAAGLRLGYLVAPPALMPRIESTVRALQYSVPPLPAEVATRWIADGSADRFVERQRSEDAARQRIARSILPAAAVAGHPASEHLWLVLPEPWRRDDFLAEARRRGVLVTGGDAFAVGRGSSPHAVRIGLCMPAERDEVARGLRILADVLAAPVTTTLSIL